MSWGPEGAGRAGCWAPWEEGERLASVLWRGEMRWVGAASWAGVEGFSEISGCPIPQRLPTGTAAPRAHSGRLRGAEPTPAEHTHSGRACSVRPWELPAQSPTAPALSSWPLCGSQSWGEGAAWVVGGTACTPRRPSAPSPSIPAPALHLPSPERCSPWPPPPLGTGAWMSSMVARGLGGTAVSVVAPLAVRSRQWWGEPSWQSRVVEGGV